MNHVKRLNINSNVIYSSSTPIQPKDTKSTSHGAYIYKQVEFIWSTSSQPSSISLKKLGSENSEARKPKEVRVGWSLGRRRKSKFWCLSLSISCPILGDQSLPSFTDAESFLMPKCCLVEVDGKEVENMGG